MTSTAPSAGPSPATASPAAASSSASGKCGVCGKDCSTRCSACARSGAEWMYYCSTAHQQLVFEEDSLWPWAALRFVTWNVHDCRYELSRLSNSSSDELLATSHRWDQGPFGLLVTNLRHGWPGLLDKSTAPWFDELRSKLVVHFATTAAHRGGELSDSDHVRWND
ncbi:hypothetical protein JCM11491_001235 [Sporobolomyces phaffii]